MIARVTSYRIRPGREDEFNAIVESAMAQMDHLKGFRGLVVLGSEDPASPDATAISLWDSVEDMKSGESNKFYYEALARAANCCESFSPMHQHVVLKTKFPRR